MLGYYNYTVWLTYLSLLSAGCGIGIALGGLGHPYIGTFFLLFSGLCDAFDGKVARTKKNRTEEECKFGIQIDSLADLVAFGVLPACIGYAMLWRAPNLSSVPDPTTGHIKDVIVPIICYIILLFYILMALVRLAYFNVTEETRQKQETGVRKYFDGMPVTSASLIFPLIMLFQFLTPADLTYVYYIGLAIVGFLFVARFKTPKPTSKGIWILIGIGLVEFLILLFNKICS